MPACQKERGAGLVLVRQGQQVYAYDNICPHFSVRLDYRPGEFSTYRGEVLMCAHHSALFRFHDGYCIEGPCQGRQLSAVPVAVQEGKVVVKNAGGPNDKGFTL
ncbi:Rieske (2Fe-2S) protein [Halomonas alkalicola]|uniref:Rieske (2Fe-2S) protein n=1 Tax=Halomonas alkalicola TaxID=1930622 RepID=UPI00345BEEDB